MSTHVDVPQPSRWQFSSRHYPSFVDDDGAVMRTFSPGPPVTKFLDGGGVVRHVKRGEIPNGRALQELVREHLGVDLTVSSSS